ncbi:putative transferase transcription factor interactor and regulator CCHC(Zn) family [Helianthus annuus]|nr:putative transferase transcription factor interactor and regulator CCHC(Zn) family [Helianthus annuus]
MTELDWMFVSDGIISLVTTPTPLINKKNLKLRLLISVTRQGIGELTFLTVEHFAPTIAAAAYLRMAGRPPVLPSSNLSYSENFLYMLDSMGDKSYKPNPRLARVLDILFILHAEHEMNCSTAAARHLASSGVDVYTALAGAVGALYGPLHGGANEAVLKMLNEIGTVDNIPEFIEGVKNRKRKMSGFGHRVYKNYDPRAKVIKQLAEEVFSIVGRDPLIEVAIALEQAALSDEYFVKRRLYPNVDFYSGLIYKAMGFPTEFFPVLFAIPRMAGYLSYWRESLDDPDTKIMRPAQKIVHRLFMFCVSIDQMDSHDSAANTSNIQQSGIRASVSDPRATSTMFPCQHCTDERRERKWLMKRCYYCNSPGHQISNCKNKEDDEEYQLVRFAINTGVQRHNEEDADLCNDQKSEYLVAGTDGGRWSEMWYVSKTLKHHFSGNLEMFKRIKYMADVETNTGEINSISLEG